MPYENGIDGCSTFVRSAAVCQTNEVQIEKRQQMNTITGFIDASMVYGSSQGEAEKLRVLDSKNLLHFSLLSAKCFGFVFCFIYSLYLPMSIRPILHVSKTFMWGDFFVTPLI